MTDSPNNLTPKPQADNVLIVTRFAYFGSSGWKHESSTDPALLFAQDRLEARLSLLKSVTLASLQGQTDQDFHHYILTSKDLPAWAKEKLLALCIETYGDAGRFTIDEATPAPARAWLRKFMQNRYGDSHVTQVVVDDDDGLSQNFVAVMRKNMQTDLEQRYSEGLSGPYFLSFPFGFGMTLGQEPLLYEHRYAYINLGLSMTAHSSDKNILSINHKTAPQRYGCRIIFPRRPMWIRSVHDFNDSRVAVGDRWVAVQKPAENTHVSDNFGYFFAKDAPWAGQASAQR